MTSRRKLVLFALLWLVAITGLHAYLNVNWGAVLNAYNRSTNAKLRSPIFR